VRLSFYDPTGGSKLGLADMDPKWAAVWREAERRGLKLGGFESPEGTRQVLATASVPDILQHL
jgi:hypothetical protein